MVFNNTTDEGNIAPRQYRTLGDIRLRKAHLETEIAKDNAKIKGLWDSLFHKPVPRVKKDNRMARMLKTGAGVVDGLLLGWKLYRKFGGKKTFF